LRFLPALAAVVVLAAGCAAPQSATSSAAPSAGPTSASAAPDASPTSAPTAPAPTPAASTAGSGARRGSESVADPARLEIPAIDVDASMVGVGLKPDGAMETPEYDSNQAGWYTKGPRPGERGPAVVAAHVDSKNGKDVFWRLRELEAGDEVSVLDQAGVEHRFVVQRSARYPKDDLPYRQIWGASDVPVLRLITCAGSYVKGAGGYQDNLVVYATAAT
jgi:sortase (surface protein transpeptidase)